MFTEPVEVSTVACAVPACVRGASAPSISGARARAPSTPLARSWKRARRAFARVAAMQRLRGVAGALVRAAASKPALPLAADGVAPRAPAAQAAWTSRFSTVVNVVRALARGVAGRPSGCRAEVVLTVPRLAWSPAQHRDTPNNNAATPFEFNAENQKMVRPRCAAAPPFERSTLNAAHARALLASRQARLPDATLHPRHPPASSRAQVAKILKRYPSNYKQARLAGPRTLRCRGHGR